jgi:hypothetical protein
MASINKNEKLLVRDLYTMQRANGDVFALDDNGHFRVPLFHSRHDAVIARLHNSEMLVFKPVALDARLLREIVPVGGAAELEFWLVNDPMINLNRGRFIQTSELQLVVGNGIKPKAIDSTINETASLTTSAFSKSNATGARQDEEGLYSKCA